MDNEKTPTTADEMRLFTLNEMYNYIRNRLNRDGISDDVHKELDSIIDDIADKIEDEEHKQNTITVH